MRSLNKEKTPGLDGIPVDFYAKFWDEIKQLLYCVYITVEEENCMIPSAMSGILNLIPKPKKDSRHLKNSRPITLLNTDYKIIEKCIANRMLPALTYLIHENQTGFMPNRKIAVNIRKLLDIIEYARIEDIPGIIVNLDYQKVFDKIEIPATTAALKFFQFSPFIIKWTQILYHEFRLKVQNNGHMSDDFVVNRGIHQGGCCSTSYFLVVAEILALMIRNNQDIEGIKIQGTGK